MLNNTDNNISSYIEGNDYFNSKFLLLLNKLPSIGNYVIDSDEYRLDLIVTKIYGSTIYGEMLLIYNGLRIDELKKGTIIKYPNLVDVNKLQVRINSERSV